MEDKERIPLVKKTIYSTYVKRGMDVFISGVALIILSPILLLIIIMEMIFHGKPIIYTSERPGKDGKIFTIYKFRSMTGKKDENGKLLPEIQRITKLGRVLRRTSLDELPQLVNIIKGDMSIIGPRPLLPEYLDIYSSRHSVRQAVRPGLACEWIKKGANDIPPVKWSWGEQFENDIWYVEHISLLLDIKMLFAVLKAAVKGSEVRTNDTRGRFVGTNLWE